MCPFHFRSPAVHASFAPPGDQPTEPMIDLAQQAIHDKARMAEIGAWSTMNANLQNHLLAAQAAGLTMIPAMVQSWDDAQAHQFAVVENLQRQDL